MAQSPDGSGTGPVRITNSSTSVTSGIGVTQKLVGAAIALEMSCAVHLAPMG